MNLGSLFKAKMNGDRISEIHRGLLYGFKIINPTIKVQESMFTVVNDGHPFSPSHTHIEISRP